MNLTNIPGGSHQITAHYAGDGIYAGATSLTAIPVTATKESSLTPFTTNYQGAKLLYGDPLMNILLAVAPASGQGFPHVYCERQ